MKPKDHAGEVFGRLTALELAPRRGKRVFWRFSCSCGKTKEIGISTVRSGLVKSCGCLHLERCRSGLNQTQHGDAKAGKVTRLHSIWRGMLKRCKPTSNAQAAKRYARRGIAVCDEWQVYVAFKEWSLANGYADDLTIDRIDNDLGYSPENCRWADRKVQARNRRTSRLITAGDRTQTVAAWCEENSISASAIQSRLARGWTEERAVTVPMKVVSKTQ